MNNGIFQEIMEGARNGDPFDTELVDILQENVEECHQACEAYGYEGADARLLSRAITYLQEYLAFYGK